MRLAVISVAAALALAGCTTGERVASGTVAGGIAGAAISGNAGGAILTFVVGDVEAAFAKAKDIGADIIEKPTDLPYGQRRLMLRDPAGTAVDISAPIR